VGGYDLVARYRADAPEWAEAGVSAPVFVELKKSEKSARQFSEAITAARESQGKMGASVYVYPDQDYRDMRLFLTEDGETGFALKDTGEAGITDIVSVFNTSGGTHRGVVYSMIRLAVEEGGNTLDAFDTFLPGVYSANGFKAVSRIKWSDDFALEGWDKASYAEFNNGEPDIVFMAYDPQQTDLYTNDSGDGEVFGDYYEAVASQRAAAIKSKGKRNGKKKQGGRRRASPGRGDEGLREDPGQDRSEYDKKRMGETPAYGKPREGAVSYVGRHYSPQPQVSLSGKFYATNVSKFSGGESKRLRNSSDSRIKNRVYFYINTAGEIKPEMGVGVYAHEVQLDNLYDPDSNLIPTSLNANDFESAVIDAGFDGYIAKPYGMAVLLGPQHAEVPVRRATEYDVGRRASVGRTGLANKEIGDETKVSKGSGGRASPVRKEGGRPESTRDGRGRDQGRKIAPLAGSPSVSGFNGPDPEIVAVAERYAKENGIELKRQAEYVNVDEDRAKRIASAYEQMKHDPQDPRVKEAYQELIKQTIAQYKALADAGYKFWFTDLNVPSNVEYLSSPYNSLRDLRNNKQMGVFPTSDGFGTSDLDVNDNPLLADTGFMWPSGGIDGELKPVLANDLFRAVHDAFGHSLEGAGFRARGEENAWQAHVRLFYGSAVGAITSETRGQNSWLNYGPYGEKNRTAKVEDTVFADQKTGLMPEWTWTEGRAADMEEAGDEVVRYSPGRRASVGRTGLANKEIGDETKVSKGSGGRASPVRKEGGRSESTGDGRGRYSGRGLAPLEGVPSKQGFYGPDPRLVEVAERYAKENGIELKRQAEYVEVDVDRAKRIANAYAEMKHDPQDPAVKEAYDELIKQTTSQYKALSDAGYEFYFIDLNSADGQEYASTPWNALRDVRANKRMGVFATEEGFGSSEDFNPEANPLLADTGFKWSLGKDGPKKRVLANDLFRAVHDAFGHGLEGASFRARGEENAWQAHIRLFTGPAQGAITSETRGQNSWLNYGPHGESNRNAKVEDTIFADQKTGLMPEWTWTEGRAADMEEAGDEVVRYSPGRQAKRKRDPEITKAAQDLKAGLIDRDQYQRIVDMRMPLRKFDEVPIPAGKEDMLRGLGDRKAGERLKRDLIQNPEDIAKGRLLEARLDIPAYDEENVWVVSLHEPRPDLNKGSAGRVVAYTPTSVFRNVTFGVTETAALNIAAGKPKSTIATMRGEYVPMTSQQAYELALGNKDLWVEIGMNPIRHTYFYDKDTQTPVVSAKEVVQVGGMVLAKNPVFGKRENYRYSPGRGNKDDVLAALYKHLEKEGVIKPQAVNLPQAADEKTTSVKNRKTDELREEAGYPPRTPPAKESFEAWESQARQKYPTAKDRLELLSQAERNPEMLGKIESAAIGQHIAYLNNRREAGENVSAELLRTIKVANVVGTEAGRALVSRKAERFSDFSLAGLISEHIRTVGKDPSEAQMREYAELADRIAKLEADNRKLSRKLARETIKRKKAEAGKETAPKPQPEEPKKGTKKAALVKKVSDAFSVFQNLWSGGNRPAARRNLRPQTEASSLKIAGDVVDGRKVKIPVPNMSSIKASLEDYEVLEGIREVPLSKFSVTGKPKYYSVSEESRTKKLSQQIKDSGIISPLIVVEDNEGFYVLEGGHRFDALRELDAKSFPAVVVRDLSTANRTRYSPGRQTESSAFREWFGDSKVVGKDGKPLVVYHGTSSEFTTFRRTRTGEFGPAIYTTADPKEAAQYGVGAGAGLMGEPPVRVMPVYVSLQTPFTGGVDAFWKQFGGEGVTDAEAVQNAISEGYDGVIATRKEWNDKILTHYIAFEPTQIKSATGNRGTFDPKNPDIRYSAGRQQPTDVRSAAEGVVAALREAGVSSDIELELQIKANIPNVTPEQMQLFRDAWNASTAKSKIDSPIGSNPDNAAIGARAKELMKAAIELGYGAKKEDWMEIVDVVHSQLSIEVPGISKYETMQAMSDYGSWRELDKGEIAVKTRAIRGKVRQSLKIEDTIKAIAQSQEWLKAGVSPDEVARRLRDKGLLPKATGQERATPDSIERDLISEFNKLKKTLPVPAESREGQLKSALSTAKTAANNRLEMLDKDIAALEEALKDRKPLVRPVAEKTELKPDEELAKLRDRLEQKRRQRDELKAQYEKIFPSTKPKKGRKTLTEEQKLEAAIKMLGRQIVAVKADVEALESGTWAPPSGRSSVTSDRKEELADELASLRKIQKQARMANPVYQAREEAKYWERYRKAQERRLAFWEKRRDEAKAGRLPVPLQKRTVTEKAILEKNLEIEEMQYEAMIAIEKAKRATWNFGQWIGQGILEATSLLPRTLMLGMEMSFVLRQGFFYTYSQPMKAFAALVEAVPAVFSQRLALASMEDIENRPNAKEYELAKVDFTRATGPQAKLEELYQSSIIKWLESTGTNLLLPLRTWAKLYAMAERGNRTFSNIMKADMYDIQKRDTLAAREFFGISTDWTEQDIKETGRIANIFSGRGTGLRGNNPWMDWLFLARRWTWSRIQADFIVPFQLATPEWIGQWNADRGMRVALAKLYIRSLVGHAAKMAAAYFAYSMLAGDDEEEKPTIEFDLRSSDALALKIGETRFKDEGGLMPAIVLASRIMTGTIKTGKGEIKSIYGEDIEYGGQTAADFLLNYGRYKLGTAPSAILEWISGRDAVGNVVKKTDIVTSRIVPLTYREIYAAESELGLARGTLAALEAFFGVSVSTHGERTKYKKASEQDRKKQFEQDLKGMEWDSPDFAYEDLLTDKQVQQMIGQRENKKQSVVYAALANPQRNSHRSDESYQQSIKERDEAVSKLRRMKVDFNEARLLLLAYYKRQYGSAYEMRGKSYVLRESFTQRLSQLRKALEQK
jgi:hypothetical protein